MVSILEPLEALNTRHNLIMDKSDLGPKLCTYSQFMKPLASLKFGKAYTLPMRKVP